MQITFEKVIKADRKKVFEAATDYENLPQMIPKRFRSVRLRSSRGDTSVVEEHIRVMGKDVAMMTKHIATPPGSHEIFVIGGDGKGSHIVETYEQAEEGTRVTVHAKIQLGGALRIVGFFGRGRILKDAQAALDEFSANIESQ